MVWSVSCALAAGDAPCLEMFSSSPLGVLANNKREEGGCDPQ